MATPKVSLLPSALPLAKNKTIKNKAVTKALRKFQRLFAVKNKNQRSLWIT